MRTPRRSRVISALVAMVIAMAGSSPGQSGIWKNLGSATAPPFRIGHGLVAVPFTSAIVAYGGSNASSQGLNDTWVFDGCTWSQVMTTSSPGGRWNFGMAASPTTDRLVVFGGGIGVGIVAGDTWELDVLTGTWTLMNPATSPSAREHGFLVFDSIRNRTVLFGGQSQMTGYSAETWEWDGSQWMDVTPTTGASPPGRAWHAMAFDRGRGRTVLYGGYNGAQFGDTWEWDGAQWTQVATASSPGPRSSGAIAYDPASQRIVLFAGSTGWPAGLNDTWEYDGTNWALVNLVGSPPPPQYLHLMASDPARGGIVVFGAYGDNWNPLSDTWRYQRALLTATTSNPSLGTTVPFALSVPANAGWSYLLGLSASGSCPGIPLPDGRFIPLNIDSILLLSISGTFPGTFQAFSGTLDAFGTAAPVLVIPSVPALTGVTLSVAAATAFGTSVETVSNGWTLMIQ